MQKLNERATKIFCRLLQILNKDEYAKIEAGSYMPLMIERFADNIFTHFGKAFMISLCHYCLQNGDLTRDPEMCFVVVDKRKNENDFENIFIYPQMFQQDSLGVYEESVHIENNRATTYIKLWQRGHCLFANDWMLNLKAQGFLR